MLSRKLFRFGHLIAGYSSYLESPVRVDNNLLGRALPCDGLYSGEEVCREKRSVCDTSTLPESVCFGSMMPMVLGAWSILGVASFWGRGSWRSVMAHKANFVVKATAPSEKMQHSRMPSRWHSSPKEKAVTSFVPSWSNLETCKSGNLSDCNLPAE